MAEPNGNRVLAAVPDVFFASKIAETARQLGVRVEFIPSQEAVFAQGPEPPSLLILDLNAEGLKPISLISKLKADAELSKTAVVSFVNHECKELIEEAKAAGCDEVLTRGAFSSGLAQILRRYR